jgi:hypothetical protein
MGYGAKTAAFTQVNIMRIPVRRGSPVRIAWRNEHGADQVYVFKDNAGLRERVAALARPKLARFIHWLPLSSATTLPGLRHHQRCELRQRLPDPHLATLLMLAAYLSAHRTMINGSALYAPLAVTERD